MKGVKMDNLTTLKFWCYKVLPLVYDDSLSYYEVLNKVTSKLNEVITTTNQIPSEIESIIKDNDKLKPLIQDIFKSIENGISTNIQNDKYAIKDYKTNDLLWYNGNLYKVTQPITEGSVIISNIQPESLENVITKYTNELNTKIDNNANELNTKIDNNINELNTKTDQTNNTLENLINNNNLGINVKDFGAKGDGKTDDTNSIQNAINTAFNNWVENPYRSASVVYFPEGHYLISSTLTIPYCVHLYSIYPVILEYTGNDVLIKFFNGNRPYYEDTPWPMRNRPHNGGKLISSKSCFLLSKRHDATDTVSAGSGTAIEIGERNNNENTLKAGGATIENTYINYFDTAIKTYNGVYIMYFNNCSFEHNRYGCVFTGTYDSGEALNFNRCVFAKNLISVQATDIYECNFNLCSFDFINTAVYMTTGLATFNQCHFEGVGIPYDTSNDMNGTYVYIANTYGRASFNNCMIFISPNYKSIITGGVGSINNCALSWTSLTQSKSLFATTNCVLSDASFIQAHPFLPVYPNEENMVPKGLLSTNYGEFDIKLNDGTSVNLDENNNIVLTRNTPGNITIRFNNLPIGRYMYVMLDLKSYQGKLTSVGYRPNEAIGSHYINNWPYAPVEKRSNTAYTCLHVRIPQNITSLGITFELTGELTRAVIVPYYMASY